jgi:RimJ/RimL family protein N-acetyltransferase
LLELFPGSFAETCPSLRDVPLNYGHARAVVERAAPGRIWVDSRSYAKAAHALHSYGMSLVWGTDLSGAFEPLIEHLRSGTYRAKDEWLQIDPRWAHLDWNRRLGAEPGGLVPGGPRAQRHTRANFRFDEAVFLDRHSHTSLRNGWTARPMTEKEFDLPGVGVTPRAFWRDAVQFLANGGGLCAEKDGEVGAIAFSSFRFDNILEIGIETRSQFRGQGLALATAAALIHKCLADGLEPVWSCRKENTASYHLAQRLGFSVTREIPYYRLPAPPSKSAIGTNLHS